MNVVPVLDLISTIGFGAALLLALRIRRDVMDPTSKLFLCLSLALYVFVGISNTLEHGQITSYLDRYEDYAEILFFPLFLSFIYSLATRQELDKRKRAEEAQKTAHTFLQSIIDSLPDPIMVINTNHRVELMNRAAREFALDTPDDSGPWLCYQLSHQRETPCDGVEHPCPLKEMRESNQPVVTLLHKHHHPNGEMRIIEIQTSPLWAADGTLWGIIETKRDVTEHKRAEEEREQLVTALQRQSTQLQTAAEVSKSASTILDPDELINQTVNLIRERFNFYYVGLFLVDETNKYAVLQAGSGEAGRRMREAGHKLEVGGPSMVGWCIAHSRARIALDVGQEAIRFDNPLLPQTHSEMALPLISHGLCIGALTVQSAEEAAFSNGDIAILQAMADQLAIAIENAWLYKRIRSYATELEDRVAERTAELAAVNKELKTFAYSASHDLRAPLRSIAGFSQALLEDYADKLDAEGLDYLHRVQAAAQRMGQLIDDLLKLSRVTRAEMRRETVDLSQMARTIAEELRKAQPERQVEFVIAEGLIAHGDAHLLQVALANLLDNAWKFTSKKPHARIEFGSTQHGGERVYFVRDNGAGFDMAYVGKLFGAFQRLHSTAEFEGTGVGLATVQRIIHRHGGRVWAEGAVKQGATFYFTLRQKEKQGAQQK